METVLDDLKIAIREGTLTKEDARILLDDINAALEIEDEALDIALKGRMLTAAATLSKIL